MNLFISHFFLNIQKQFKLFFSRLYKDKVYLQSADMKKLLLYSFECFEFIKWELSLESATKDRKLSLL